MTDRSHSHGPSSLKSLARAVTLAGCLLGNLAWTTAEGRTIVLHASGPSAKQWHAGQILREPIQVRLVKEDTLTLLDDRGARELSGPQIVNDAEPHSALPGGTPLWHERLASNLRVRGDR